MKYKISISCSDSKLKKAFRNIIGLEGKISGHEENAFIVESVEELADVFVVEIFLLPTLAGNTLLSLIRSVPECLGLSIGSIPTFKGGIIEDVKVNSIYISANCDDNKINDLDEDDTVYCELCGHEIDQIGYVIEDGEGEYYHNGCWLVKDDDERIYGYDGDCL